MGQTLVGYQSAALPVVSRPSSAPIKLRPFTDLSPRQIDKARSSARHMFPGDSGPIDKSIDAALSPPDAWPKSYREVATRVVRHAAYSRDRRVGMTGFAVLNDGEQGTIWLEWMGVRPKRLGEGFGRKLLTASMEFALQNGFGTMRLWTTTDHAKAIGMYNSAGFTSQDTPYQWNDGNAVQIHSIGLYGQGVQPYRGVGGDVGTALYGVRRYVQRRQPS